MKISVAVLGNKMSVEVENGANATDALAVFERLTGKVVNGMDLFKGGQKVEANTPLEDGDEIVAVKSKHESASGVKITLKVLGSKFEIECEDGTCGDALETFERVTSKAIKEMDLFRNGQKLSYDAPLEDGDEIVAVKSKHESAGGVKIKLKVLGAEFEIECEDGTCGDALETFERVTNKAIKEMDLFRNGAKLTGNEPLEDGDEIVAVKSKHESAS